MCHLNNTMVSAGGAASTAALKKKTKYADLSRNFYFVLFAVETFGPWSDEAIDFADSLGKLLKERTRESRSRQYLVQRISIKIQRGNAASILFLFISLFIAG